MSSSFDIAATVERELTEAQARARALKTGATLTELADRFRITSMSARRIFKDACILPGRPAREGVYDRALVCDVLSSANGGRSVGYPSEPMLTPQEAVDYLAELGRPRKLRTIYHWSREGKGPGVKVGGVLRFARAGLVKLAKELAVNTGGPKCTAS